MEQHHGTVEGECKTVAVSTSAAVHVDVEGLLKRGLGNHPTTAEILHSAGGRRTVRHLE